MDIEQIKIIKHTVGLNRSPKQKEYYRNYFNASKCHSNYRTLEILRADGIMKRVKSDFGDSYYYFLTDKGLEIAQEFNQYKPKTGFVIEST